MADKKRAPAEKAWPYDWQESFLVVLRNSANVRASCQAVKITRSLAYKIRASSVRFATAWDEAVEDAIDTLEAAAWQRARQQSDYLLWRLLAANRREKYGDAVKVTIDYEREAARIAAEQGLPPEQASKIISLAEKLKQGRTG